ncbi:MFS transporter, partial [Catenulispora sp. NF23]|nr:MFS transporter [Catenulispora pinistramenti]
VVVMLGVAELTDHTDSRWGFAVAASVSFVAALVAGVLLRGASVGAAVSDDSGDAGDADDSGGVGGPDGPDGAGPDGGCHTPANADVRVVTA